MASCPGLKAGRKYVKNAHHVVKTHGVLVRDFHRLQLLQAGAFTQFVLATRIHIAFQVTNIGHVAHVAHLVA